MKMMLVMVRVVASNRFSKNWGTVAIPLFRYLGRKKRARNNVTTATQKTATVATRGAVLRAGVNRKTTPPLFHLVRQAPFSMRQVTRLSISSSRVMLLSKMRMTRI